MSVRSVYVSVRRRVCVRSVRVCECEGCVSVYEGVCGGECESCVSV